MDIYKVKNYKTFADELTKKTGCDVTIAVLERNHFHYQLNKMGISLGVLCVNDGEVSFAPFETLESAKNNQYINVKYAPMFDDFVHVLNVFKNMFTTEEPADNF